VVLAAVAEGVLGGESGHVQHDCPGWVYLAVAAVAGQVDGAGKLGVLGEIGDFPVGLMDQRPAGHQQQPPLIAGLALGRREPGLQTCAPARDGGVPQEPVFGLRPPCLGSSMRRPG